MVNSFVAWYSSDSMPDFSDIFQNLNLVRYFYTFVNTFVNLIRIPSDIKHIFEALLLHPHADFPYRLVVMQLEFGLQTVFP